jgi:biofilm PGA synthesis N-glycosyltransferase PgaC
MVWAAFIFWFLLAGVIFAYLGYPLLLALLRPLRHRYRQAAPLTWPPVTLVIAAYNEAAILPEKLRNCLALAYPKNCLRILVVADGSTDATANVVSAFPGVTLLLDPLRGGKTAALNRALREVRTPFVVFSDANTLLPADAVTRLLRPFGDPKTGAVAGEKRVRHSSGMGFAEGWYWHYESFLKQLDAGFYSVVGAAGELFALRTELFTELPNDTLLDDLALSLEVSFRGYRIAYEPAAYAMEAPSGSLASEQRRKVRIAAGAFQLLSRLRWRRFLNFKRLGFQFFVRRWMRWVFCPLALPLLFILNLVLALSNGAYGYQVLFGIQLALYALAFFGAVLLRRNRAFLPATIPFYFLFMNYCLLAGWSRFRQGKQSVLWERAR